MAAGDMALSRSHDSPRGQPIAASGTTQRAGRKKGRKLLQLTPETPFTTILVALQGLLYGSLNLAGTPRPARPDVSNDAESKTALAQLELIQRVIETTEKSAAELGSIVANRLRATEDTNHPVFSRFTRRKLNGLQGVISLEYATKNGTNYLQRIAANQAGGQSSLDAFLDRMDTFMIININKRRPLAWHPFSFAYHIEEGIAPVTTEPEKAAKIVQEGGSLYLCSLVTDGGGMGMEKEGRRTFLSMIGQPHDGAPHARHPIMITGKNAQYGSAVAVITATFNTLLQELKGRKVPLVKGNDTPYLPKHVVCASAIASPNAYLMVASPTPQRFANNTAVLTLDQYGLHIR